MTTAIRATRSDGARGRRTILEAAAKLATVEGLNGLSIGRLAEHIGMSKSGLFAHFGSKEELQLATIDTAMEIFVGEVIEPTLAIKQPLQRLEALCDLFLDHVHRETFPGGCFFAAVAAEFAPHPGPVQDRIKESTTSWLSLFVDLAHDAQAAGELSPDEDLEQFAFDIDAALLLANLTYVLHQSPAALDRGIHAVRARIQQAKDRARARSTSPVV